MAAADLLAYSAYQQETGVQSKWVAKHPLKTENYKRNLYRIAIEEKLLSCFTPSLSADFLRRMWGGGRDRLGKSSSHDLTKSPIEYSEAFIDTDFARHTDEAFRFVQDRLASEFSALPIGYPLRLMVTD